MAVSKALFVALGILLPMVVVQSLALLDFGLAPGRFPAALLDGVVAEVMVIAVLGILVVLTQNLAEYLLALMAFFALEVFIVGVLNAGSLLEEGEGGILGKLASGDDITGEAALLLALSLLILFHQYLTRRSGRSLAMMGLAGVLFFVLKPAPQELQSPRDRAFSDQVPLMESSEPRLVFKGSSEDDRKMSRIFMQWPLLLKVEGLRAEGDCRRLRFRGHLRFTDGRTVSLRESSPRGSTCATAAVRREISKGPAVDFVLEKSDRLALGLIPAQDLEISGVRKATLEGELYLESLRLRVSDAGPPTTGQVLQAGSQRVHLEAVTFSKDRVQVQVRARKLGLRAFQKVSAAELLLVNSRTASGTHVAPFEHMPDPRRLVMARPPLFAKETKLTTGSEGGRSAGVEELSLLRVELEPVSEQRVSVRLEEALGGIWSDWNQEDSR